MSSALCHALLGTLSAQAHMLGGGVLASVAQVAAVSVAAVTDAPVAAVQLMAAAAVLLLLLLLLLPNPLPHTLQLLLQPLDYLLQYATPRAACDTSCYAIFRHRTHRSIDSHTPPGCLESAWSV